MKVVTVLMPIRSAVMLRDMINIILLPAPISAVAPYVGHALAFG